MVKRRLTLQYVVSENNLGLNVKLVVKFESEAKSLMTDIAEDSKKMLTLANSSYSELKEEAEKRLAEIQNIIDNDKRNTLDSMRKEYTQMREKKIAEIKKAGQKNLDKATEELLNALLGAFK